MDKIAVLIPCYNEEKTIAKVVADAKAALPEAVIYVYDNNSTDRTVELARQAGAVIRTLFRSKVSAAEGDDSTNDMLIEFHTAVEKRIWLLAAELGQRPGAGE